MRVKIKASKTDPFRKGSDIHIGLGRHPLCAVQAMMAYLSQRGGSPGPLFCLQDGRPLSRGLLTQWLRPIMAAAGIAGNFSSHSFCIGPATVAARNGVPDHLIQALGRWTSNVYQLHIRTPSEALASLSLQLSWDVGKCIPAPIAGFCSMIGLCTLCRRVSTLHGMCVSVAFRLVS